MAWLIVASVLACVGLGLALEANGQGASRASVTTAAIYAGVLVVLGAVGYVVHRDRWTAVGDTLVSGLVGGPGLLFAIALVTTIRDCSTGPGC